MEGGLGQRGVAGRLGKRTELRGIAAGRADLLSEVAGLSGSALSEIKRGSPVIRRCRPCDFESFTVLVHLVGSSHGR
jgi:hypothetical protein